MLHLIGVFTYIHITTKWCRATTIGLVLIGVA
jgi:hypothetical protein